MDYRANGPAARHRPRQRAAAARSGEVRGRRHHRHRHREPNQLLADPGTRRRQGFCGPGEGGRDEGLSGASALPSLHHEQRRSDPADGFFS